MEFIDSLNLDKEKVHYIKTSKRFIIEVKGEKCELCEIEGKYAYARRDQRGKKSKFWILCNDEYKYLLKYESRQNQSHENAGQFIMCGILKQLNFPCTDYLVTTFEKDGELFDAILSKNYREKDDVVEISGHGLNNKFYQREYDNNMGEKPKKHHTINFYIDVFKKLYGRNKINFEGLRRDLVKIALLQYVYIMSDLHFYNLSFMYNEKEGHKSMRLVPLYDCGNICTLNLSNEKIKNNLSQLLKSNKKGVVVDNFMYTKMPMFGIDSELCTIFEEKNKTEVCRPNCDEVKGEKRKEVAKKDLQIFREELANEIIKDKELENFYKKIKENINLDEISQYYNNIKSNTIPDYCLQIVKEISNITIKKLDKVIDKQKEEIKLCNIEKQTKEQVRG